MKYLEAADRKLAWAEKAALVVLICAMVGLSFTQVVLRVVFSKGIMWADPLLRHMVMWAGFFGAALAARKGAHFSFDAASRFMTPKIKRVADIAARCFVCLVCAALLFAAFKFLRDESVSEAVLFSIGNMAVKAVWLETAIPLGFLLIIFHAAAGIFLRQDGEQ